MPRNPHSGASTLRNRNRITNKTRLKIQYGNIEADALFIPDEDDEKDRLTNLVAGVDAEDANEHHLQEVLSGSNGVGRHATRAESSTQQAFIPTPDSTGVVDNYDQLYPNSAWKDPKTYIFSSSTVDENVKWGLSGGFNYYMDERDKEWLDKHNESARGEGTSAQGSVSSASNARTSPRTSKGKGKEPENQDAGGVISDDLFEVVMGLFEKITTERTEYLHHGLETGMEFPAFSEYQDFFGSAIPPATFSSGMLPSLLPLPASMLRVAEAVYFYWRERRIERGGHRIIPVLNFDESDTLNESYICFRRRETKAVRKTRASQATPTDKLARLHAELAYPLELANAILLRETQKIQCQSEAQNVWFLRRRLVDLKRENPSLGDKADEEFLVEKERPKKIPNSRIPNLKIRTGECMTPARGEVSIKPSERIAKIRDHLDAALDRQIEVDHHWEDQVDNPYQAPLVPYTSRLFKYIPPPDTHVGFGEIEDEDKPRSRMARSIRMRYGRGGRVHIDRRDFNTRSIGTKRKRSALLPSDDEMDVQEDDEESERKRRLEERWKFDLDDVPAVGPRGADEENRILIDDYDFPYLSHRMILMNDADHYNMLTDPSLVVQAPDGRQQVVVPFRLGGPPTLVRRDQNGVLRAYHPLINGGIPSGAMPSPTGVSIKKMPPPNAIPQMRISSNGGMRPPSATPNHQANGSVLPSPHPLPVPHHSSASRAAISMPHVDLSNPDSTPIPIQVDQAKKEEVEVTIKPPASSPSPTRLPAHGQNHPGLAVPTNGFHLTPMSSHAAAALANVQRASQPNERGLTMQQLQELKSVFANLPAADQLAMLQANNNRAVLGNVPMPNGNNVNVNVNGNVNGMTNGSHMQQLAAGGHMNLKLPVSRQMQVNGQTAGVNKPGVNGQTTAIPTHSASPPIQAAPSPSRAASMTMTSPLLQHQQPAGNTQGSY